MIRLLGSKTMLCDGLTRRDFLHLGGLGAFGLGLSSFLHLQQAQAAEAVAPTSFGKAKACILLFPYGSPPQHETFDPKPDAPAEIRGEIGAMPSAVPGTLICDRLPRIAAITDRLTIVRSVTHPYAEHGVAYAVSGIPTYTPALETRPRDPQHWPFIGSVVAYLEERRTGQAFPPVPRNVGLPWLLNSKTDLRVDAGPYAAFLGAAYDPVWADYDGRGLKIAPKYGEGQAKEFHDPFAACTPEGKFHFSSADQPGDDAALAVRQSLLEQFDRARQQIDADAKLRVFDRQHQQALALLLSGKARAALDVTREPAAVRERYGMTLFGQACLAARRLVEAGSKFITVFWDGFGQFAGCAWDTHANHYPRLKEYLLPGFDLAYSALILDLEARGLLDETLVIWMSEHGRTPKIDTKPKGCGRHHWSKAYSVALAGGGVARGKVVGSSDRIGGEVRDTPVSPKDILATTLHLLGIDPETTVSDAQNRPFPVAGTGRVRPEVLS
jgi:hypothetical protein